MTSRTQELKIDNLKKLPVDLLLHILELSLPSMKTRVAVQACILFKKWNHLWPFFTSLDFDLNEFNSGDPKQDKERFSHFVSTMLECRKAADLDKFRLSCGNLCEKQYHFPIFHWILYALQHKVKVLELTLCPRIGSLMKQCIFACKSLEELHFHLNDCGCLPWIVNIPSVSINLPRLQKLHLRNPGLLLVEVSTNLILDCPLLKDLWLESFIVSYSSITSLENLMSLTFNNCELTYNKVGIGSRVNNTIEKMNFPSLRKLFFLGEGLSFGCYILELMLRCPLLEDLWLESFSVPFWFTICSQKLQRLTLKNCKNTDRLISIKAPCLVSFCFVGLIEDVVVLSDKVGVTSSLVHVNVSLHDRITCDSYILKYTLKSFSHVENLELCVHKFAESPQYPTYYPTLYNLKNLSICGHCFNYVLYMWKGIPNLEKITLWLCCQHSLWSFESLEWDNALFGVLIQLKKFKEVEVISAAFDEQERQLIHGFRELKDVKITISMR